MATIERPPYQDALDQALKGIQQRFAPRLGISWKIHADIKNRVFICNEMRGARKGDTYTFNMPEELMRIIDDHNGGS